MAAVCLMVCGVIFFVASVGHAVAASAAYLLVSRATASADIGVPLRVPQSSGASGRALRSAIPLRQDAGEVWLVSRVHRSLRPLPRQ